MTTDEATKQATSRTRQGSGFSDVEKAAMKERAKELKAARTRKDGEADVLAKIAEMPPEDRELATAFHALVTGCAPDLVPRTWYGMPAYAKDGTVVCYFQSGATYESRYCTVGFSDSAHLDQGSLWPTAFGITAWNATNEKKIRALVAKAVGR